jgi:AbrB family looped-hinge helix DNA binding protein
MQRVKIGTRYQIVVPASIRRELGVGPGDHLLLDVRDGVIVLVPVPTDPVDALRGLGREIWEGTDAQEYVNQLRDEW